VEGHGEVASVPILLERIWYELLRGEYIEVLRPPIRQPKSRLRSNKNDALARAIHLAAAKLAGPQSGPVDAELILVIVDADEDIPCELGPEMLHLAEQARPDQLISCVVACTEYESWIVGGSSTLSSYLELADENDPPPDPESNRLGKRWIQRRFKGVKYSETIDQPKLTAKMDLLACRRGCPSFDKLCRGLEGVMERQ
jgi:hypothetical protein